MISHSKPSIKKYEIERTSKVLMSGNHATGEIVEKFEKKLSSFIGVEGGVATNSGTSALHIALLVLGVKPNDEVIIPSFVCTALMNAIGYVGAKPVLADIGEDTFNIDYKSVLAKLTKKTKVVIIPHMFGLPVNVAPFLNSGIYIIEDCAQSLGAAIGRRITGSVGHISIFSFYATKLISTGYGGMLVSNSKTFLNRARDLLDFDERRNCKLRFNYNMTDFQAALGISQLARLKDFIRKRIETASYYDKRFDKLPMKLPIRQRNIYYRYVVRIDKDAVSIISCLKRYGIEAKRPVFKPLHLYLGLERSKFPAAEKVFREAVSLPIYPDLKDGEKRRVADTLITVLDDRL